jgi:hypothetical protein
MISRYPMMIRWRNNLAEAAIGLSWAEPPRLHDNSHSMESNGPSGKSRSHLRLDIFICIAHRIRQHLSFVRKCYFLLPHASRGLWAYDTTTDCRSWPWRGYTEHACTIDNQRKGRLEAMKECRILMTTFTSDFIL